MTGALALSIICVMGLYVLATESTRDYLANQVILTQGQTTQTIPPDFDPHIPGREPDLSPSKDHLITAENGAVACDVPVCSKMGVDILRRGGSAVDSAITVALCIGTINGFSSGLGGGGFMLVKNGKSDSKFLNFREMAPSKSHKHMFDDDPQRAQIGGLAVAIPGELAGLEEAFNRYSSGVLSWAELFEPVIKLNREGFRTSFPVEVALKLSGDSILSHPEEWHPYLKDGDDEEYKLVTEGDLIKRPDHARTMELIANNGSSAIFYDPHGPIAPAIARASQNRGGILTADDFSHFKVEVLEPEETDFMGRELLTTGNPSSGPALIFGLNVLDGYEKNDDHWVDFDPLDTHRLVETMKFMGSQRSCLGDDNSNKDKVDLITTQEWASKVRENITDDTTHEWDYYDPMYEHNDDHGTAHFSVLDKNGMAVSMTTTVNLNFGAQVADPVTGIILNSEMDDFSLPNTSNWFELSPSIYNYIEPFKRPLSSMVPTIISNKTTGEPELVIGCAGGSRITTSVMQAIIRRLRYQLPLLETISYPRIHHQLLPDQLYLEHLSPKATIEALKQKGHNITLIEPKTAMNAIYRYPNDGLIHAVSDFWRKAGQAAGY